MPFTPFHFGAHACVALPFNKKINILVFLLANVIIDIEPLVVILFDLSYPLHGYAHTLLGAAIIGCIWGLIAYAGKKVFERILKFLKLPHKFHLEQYIYSGISGALLHVLFDAPLYHDIRPFYPLKINTLYGLAGNSTMYKVCTFLFIPALLIYCCVLIKNRKIKSS